MPEVNLGARSAARSAPAATRSASTAAGSESSRDGTVTGVVRLEFPDGVRDPFTRQFPEGETPIVVAEEVDLGAPEVVDLGPLANFPVESLRLQAIVTRTAEPRAMFLLPDGRGLAVLARVDDRVGPNGTGRIADIQPNRVIVSYEGVFGFGEDGEQARTLVLTLRDPSQDIEAEFVPY